MMAKIEMNLWREQKQQRTDTNKILITNLMLGYYTNKQKEKENDILPEDGVVLVAWLPWLYMFQAAGDTRKTNWGWIKETFKMNFWILK